jgi:Icc-related predicted phosphoesterase
VKNKETIKILSVSDVVEPQLHRVAGQEPFADIRAIISCGDLPPEYLSRLVNAFGAPLFYVSGNHDIRYKKKLPEGGVNLHGRIEKVAGLHFLGLEGSHWYNGGPFQYTEAQMRAVVRRLRPKLWWRGGVDVVITHAPPLHIHDADDPCHQGFEIFRWLINKYQPQYFIHGHIHRQFSDPSERETVFEATKVVNTYGYNILEI